VEKMIIKLTYGSGKTWKKGATKLAAFHAALIDAGIPNYNLIRLSSVLPTKSKVVFEKVKRTEKENGHRLYVVIADSYATKKGKHAVAGLGWVQREDGFGFFVEHTGKDEQEVRDYIRNDLIDMVRRESDPNRFGAINYKTHSVRCTGEPVCAVVAAVYESQGWR